MIGKCPKCGSYTNGEVSMLDYVDIIGGEGYDELYLKGVDIAESVEKSANDKLGDNIFGKSVGVVSKNFVKAAAQTAGGYRYLLHAVPSVTEYKEYFCFKCKNKNCSNKWVEKCKDSLDRKGEFYGECISAFKKCVGRRYLILNPDADTAYDLNDNIFMLPYIPVGIIVPDEFNNKGVILVSHPAYPEKFYTLEKFRIKVLQDELDDLAIFLQKLGASTIRISGMSDSEIDQNEEISIKNKMAGACQGASADIDLSIKNEIQEYKRLREEFKGTIKSEIQTSPIFDRARFERWKKYNQKWEKILELRVNGTSEISFSLSTEDVTNARKMELERVSATYSEFGLGSVNNDYAQSVITNVKKSSKLKFNVYAKFYSLKDYNDSKIIEK